MFENHVAFILDATTVELTEFFEGGTEFVGKIAIADRYYASQIVHFKVTGDKPRLVIIQVDDGGDHNIENVEEEAA